MQAPGQTAGEPEMLTSCAFGLGLSFETQPPGAWEPQPAREPRLQIRLATAQEVEDSWSGLREIGWEAVIDGAPFVVERGLAGDHRFVHGAPPDRRGAPAGRPRAVHHLSADASVLRCAPANPADPSWWRVVLDSVLFTVALLQGYEALHAGAVATSDGVIAITAASGGGKSTLLTELLARGAKLMADDVLVLESRGAGAPFAYPAPPLMTVPDARIAELGGPSQTISRLEGEHWIAFPVQPEPLPLKALVVLDRRPESQLPERAGSLRRIEDPLAPLLGSLMNFPRSAERQQARFELAGVLASEIGLWRLTAGLETPPAALADTLLSGEL